MYMLNVQVTDRQPTDDKPSCNPLKIFGAPIISLERLNLKSSNFVHMQVISVLATGWYIIHRRGVVMVTWPF